MNLAFKDIRHNRGRFVLTTVGIGTLLMLVMGMGGIYRGLVEDATLLVDRAGADLWVVQKDTRGPFAEMSRIPRSVEDRARAVRGVAAARAFVSHTVQRQHDGRSLRMTVQGLTWPADKGEWLPVVAGRTLGQAHYEMIADVTLGLALGEKVRLGKETYTVVGQTRGMLSSSGDGLGFFTLADAQAVQFDQSGEAVRLERAARVERLGQIDLGRRQPQLSERAAGTAAGIPALGTSVVSAVLVDVAPGAEVAAVRQALASWPDVTVYGHEEQRDLLLKGNVDRARRQLGLFRVLLIVVSAIIMALILYTLTIDKLHDIAMLKLIGARNRVILALILQQALLLGLLGYGIAYLLGQWIFPRFPRRVIVVAQDLYSLSAIVLGISLLSSVLGIWKALRVEPGEVLS
jgi:putative ABC transport system permease protein